LFRHLAAGFDWITAAAERKNIMLLPFDSVMNLMYTAVPIYEWEPVPVAQAQPGAPAPDGAAAAGGAGEGASEPATSLQLVFKGMRWIQVPMWSLRENAAFNQVSQDQRDDDVRRNQERSRYAQRVNATPTQAAGAQGADTAPDAPAGTEGGVD
jgi:hypothetical protein